MKKIIGLIISSLTAFAMYSQGFNYKALITDNGNPLSNQPVNVKFTVLDGGATVYSEEHAGVSTDAHGILSVNIGEGNPLTGNFSNVNFRRSLSLKVEVDTGSGYQDFGTEDFKYVPYAKVADKLNVTDKVHIGANSAAGEKLFVMADPSGVDLVEFYLQNASNANDVLQLTMDAPTSGTAQFIEAYTTGTGTVFRLNHDGSIEMDGDLTIGGKIKTSTAGNTDLKAYVYGEVFSDGTIASGNSSSGFTVQKISTGKYKITLTGVSGFTYLPIVSALQGGGGEIATYEPHSGYFYVYITDDSGTLEDSHFSFVVFKK